MPTKFDNPKMDRCSALQTGPFDSAPDDGRCPEGRRGERCRAGAGRTLVDILFQSEPQIHRLVGPQRNNGNGIQEQCHTNGLA
jgi:hypothetical protein